MKTYDVYAHPALGHQAVKQGFSWPGFFFNWIWACVKQMWGVGAGLLIAGLILGGFQEVGDGGIFIGGLGQLALLIFVGAKGNDWRRSKLSKQGFEKAGTIEAQSPEAAIAEAVKKQD